MNVDLHYSQHFQDTVPSFTLVTKQLPQSCVHPCSLLWLLSTRETILNGFTLDQFLSGYTCPRCCAPKRKEGKIGIVVARFQHLRVWMVFEIRVPLKDDRTSIVPQWWRNTVCAFARRNAASIVTDGSLKMSPLLVFSAARTLNTPPENVYFHFKVHFGILLLVSFDPRKRR